MTIEFISDDFSNRDVRERLKKAFEDTEILRGAVAFWKIGLDFFGDALISALQHPLSFFIVDVSSPTDFNAILEIHNVIKSSPAFYVHCKRYEPKKGIREGLLHSKILVMEKKDGSTEIWVGSHNFTKSALSGLNIESSIALHIPANVENTFKNDIIIFLVNLLNEKSVTSFDEKSYYYFLALQDATRTEWLKKYLKSIEKRFLNGDFEFYRSIEIEGNNLSNIQNSTIIILGDDKKDLFEIDGFGQKIIIQAYDSSGVVVFYKGRIRARDTIDTSFSKEVEFGKRRIGIKDNTKERIRLDNIGIIKEKDLDNKGFYINIHIEQKLPNDKKVVVYNHPDYKKLWKVVSKDSNESEILEGQGVEEFKKSFLPQKIQEFDEQKSEILLEKNQKKPRENILSEMFERRIYVWFYGNSDSDAQ